MTNITPSVVLDLVQVGAGLQVKNRTNDEAWYVLKFEKEGGFFRTRNVTTIHRAPVDDKGTLPLHFAQWDDRHLEIIKKMPEGSKEKPGISRKYKVREFLQKRENAGFFEAANVFYVNRKPYRLIKAASAGRTLELFALEDPTTPLALFRQHSNFSSAIASIRIYPAAVGLDIEEEEGCLVWDGKPTKLLERAIIAERLCKASQPWWSRI